MKRFLCALLAALLALGASPAALAETILWEDENGAVILENGGTLVFTQPLDGGKDEGRASTPTPTPEPTPVPTPAPTPTPSPAPTPSPLPAPEKTLQYGDSGEHVLAAQERLTALGYYHGQCSGRFLEGTQSAARRFQKLNGLSQTGKLDAKTWAVLFSAAAIARDGSTPDATPSPVPVLTPTPTPTPFAFKRTLRYGDNGELVEALQSRLAELGFYQARVSGGFYQVTKNAVRAFQEHNGLPVDGIAGQQTQEALFSAGAVPVSATPKPSPTPEPAKYLLAVDVANQLTRAYTYDENGGYTVLVREMICSTGTASHPTPLGTYIMPKGRARWGYFPTWGSHAQYLTRIDSANAFHSVLYSEPVESALVVSSYDALGSPASHGCVRLLVSDAKWIYENCEPGTIITVFEGEYDPEYTMSLKPSLNSNTLRERSLPEPTPTPVYSADNWPSSYRTLSRGKKGEDVFMLQTRLTELGYYHGTITGGYYGGTIAAVEAFQRDHGLEVDGAAGEKTQSLLFSSAADPTPMPAAAESGDSASPLLSPSPGADASSGENGAPSGALPEQGAPGEGAATPVPELAPELLAPTVDNVGARSARMPRA